MSNFLSLFKKELIGYFQSLISYIFIVVFLVVLSWLFWQNAFLIGQTNMRGFFTLIPWFFLFLVPALSMRLWSEEKKLGTIETLFTLPISDMQAVFAKFAAAKVFLAIVLLFSLPIPISLSRIGDLDWGPVIGSYIGAWLLGCSYLALGQWISSLTKNQIIAFLITIAVAFAFMVIGLPVVIGVGGVLAKAFHLLSTQSHFTNLSKGVIDLRDIVYYLSFIAVFLYLNIHSLAKRKKTLHTLSQVLLGIAIVVIVNMLLMGVSLRIDLTENKQYTLASASKNIVRDLQDPVTIKVYLSEEVPQGMIALRQDIEDLMNEYDRVGKSNTIVEIADPKEDDIAQQEVQTYRIPELQYNIVGSEKFEVSTGYAGIAIVYGDSYEVIEAVTTTETLEYDITAAIQKMAREEIPTIGFLSDHGVTETRAIQRYLEQQYTVTSVTSDSITQDIDGLVIAGPTEEFTDAELYAIDQYVMNGGNLFVMLEGMTVNEQTLQLTERTTKLDELVAQYGITINKDVVADFASAEVLTFGGGFFSIMREYPFWPKIISDGLNQEHPIAAKVQSFVLPWPSSLTVEASDGVEITEIAKTTYQSYAFNDIQSVNPEVIATPPETSFQEQLIAVLASGNFTSKYANADLPEGVEAEGFVSQTENANVVVVGSSEWIADSILERSIENGIVLVNAIDTLTQDDSLISIRSRSALDRPIQVLTDGKKASIKYVNIFSSVIIVVIVAGAFHYIRRRRDRKAEVNYV